jgi:hypothetical protein
MVPLFVLILIAAVLCVSGTGRPRNVSSSRRCPAKARATKAAAPDTTTMTEWPAISSAVFSLRHRHNLRTAIGCAPLQKCRQPDTSSQTHRIPDRSEHPVLRETARRWLQVRLGWPLLEVAPRRYIRRVKCDALVPGRRLRAGGRGSTPRRCNGCSSSVFVIIA